MFEIAISGCPAPKIDRVKGPPRPFIGHISLHEGFYRLRNTVSYLSALMPHSRTLEPDRRLERPFHASWCARDPFHNYGLCSLHPLLFLFNFCLTAGLAADGSSRGFRKGALVTTSLGVSHVESVFFPSSLIAMTVPEEDKIFIFSLVL